LVEEEKVRLMISRAFTITNGAVVAVMLSGLIQLSFTATSVAKDFRGDFKKCDTEKVSKAFLAFQYKKRKKRSDEKRLLETVSEYRHCNFGLKFRNPVFKGWWSDEVVGYQDYVARIKSRSSAGESEICLSTRHINQQKIYENCLK
jgi:hypothetical protein